MSRSRKKTAIFKQKNDKWYKRRSNKKIRKTDIPSGGAFRRVVNSYDICDYARFADLKVERPPESNEKRYLVVVNKSRKKYDFDDFVFGG